MNILVVDDDFNIRKTLTALLEGDNHTVMAAENARDAMAIAAMHPMDMACVDLRLGMDNGLDLVSALVESAPWMRIMVITAYASIETAVEAIRRGAVDYLPKPFTPTQLRVVVERMAKMQSLEKRVAALESDLVHMAPDTDFNSTTPAMQGVLHMARQVAATDAVVLLLGESGTGKSMLARAIHSWSHRAAQPFGVVSCPTLSHELLESELFGHVKGAFTGAQRDNPGRIPACDKGTLFLDEIGDLSLAIQPKLLRFLQERRYERVGDHITRKADVRIIAATNVNLEETVRERRFREDLYYRLNVIQIVLPPLRERMADLERMAMGMLLFFNQNGGRSIRGFTREAMELMQRYPWPGNLRELRNVVERAVILCHKEWIGPDMLPDNIAHCPPAPRIGDPLTLVQLEELHIRKVLAATHSLQDAASLLGIDQATLWRRRKLYNI